MSKRKSKVKSYSFSYTSNWRTGEVKLKLKGDLPPELESFAKYLMESVGDHAPWPPDGRNRWPLAGQGKTGPKAGVN